jgi:hypothetical protein
VIRLCPSTTCHRQLRASEVADSSTLGFGRRWPARTAPCRPARNRTQPSTLKMLVPLQKGTSGEDQLALPPLSCAQASRRLPWMACHRPGVIMSGPAVGLVE